MSSFDDLAEQFRTRFVTNIPPAKSIHDLRVCRQEANKSLRSYLYRFNKIVMRIQNLSDETAIEALKNGTRLGRLKDDILVYEPSTFTEVMTMATKLIKMDEDRRLRRVIKKCPSRMMRSLNLGDPDLHILSSKVRQAQPTDTVRRLKTIYLLMLRDQRY